MQFGLLGTVALWRDGREVPVSGAHQRTVLAMLLLDAGQVVSMDRLIDTLWDDEVGGPPPRARNMVQRAVSGLRRVLAPDQIVFKPPGYLLAIEADQVDLHRFRRLTHQARSLDDDQQAANLFRQALGLWRADPLADVDAPRLAPVRAALAEERLSVLETYLDHELRLGRHTEHFSKLTTLVAGEPFRERLRALLMLALHRAGRTADALQVYREALSIFRDELGTEPGPDLRQLHQRILSADPTLDHAASDPRPATGPPVIPRQLPAPPAGFIGRADEVARLTDVVGHARQAGTMAIATVIGMGGIGKSWLTLHWAHQHLDLFPDGQLFANLRGFDPSGRPSSYHAVIRAFLDGLGVEPSSIPTDPDALLGLFRSLLVDKRMLIVLDNVRDAAQVIPLLPGTPSCTVLISSRDHLTSLVTAHGAQPVQLAVLPTEQALAQLAARIDPDRLAAEPTATAKLLSACGGLPLALSIVAGRAQTHPKFPLATLAAELRDTVTRLGALDQGSPTDSLSTVLSWSYAALPAQHARVFGLLGLAPGPDISLPAAASLTALPVNELTLLLRALEHVSLVEEHHPGRYRMHNLIRLYAADRARHDQSPSDQNQALRRLIDYYLHTADTAITLLLPHEQRRPIPGPAPDIVTTALPDDAAAHRWLAAEQANFLAAASSAASRDRPGITVIFAATLRRYLITSAFYTDALTLHQDALTAARQHHDRAGQAAALDDLGSINQRIGRYEQAADNLHEALTLFHDLDDADGQARALGNLGIIQARLGQYQRAAHCFQRALDLFRELGYEADQARALGNLGIMASRIGQYEQAKGHLRQALALSRKLRDRPGQAANLNNLGSVYERTGRYQRANDHHQQALTLSRAFGVRDGQARALTNLGIVYERLGQYGQATEHHQQALTIFRELGDPEGEAWALTNLGTVYQRTGLFEQATELHQQALSRFRTLRDPAGQARALNGLGDTARAAGNHPEAITHHTEALRHATSIGDRHQQADAHRGLGHTHLNLGDSSKTHDHWHHALTLYEELGAPEADELRTQLTALDPPASQ